MAPSEQFEKTHSITAEIFVEFSNDEVGNL